MMIGVGALGDVLQDAVNKYAAIGQQATCQMVHVDYPGTNGYDTPQCTVAGDNNYHDASLVSKMTPAQLQAESNYNRAAAGAYGVPLVAPTWITAPGSGGTAVGPAVAAPTITPGKPVTLPAYDYSGSIQALANQGSVQPTQSQVSQAAKTGVVDLTQKVSTDTGVPSWAWLAAALVGGVFLMKGLAK